MSERFRLVRGEVSAPYLTAGDQHRLVQRDQASAGHSHRERLRLVRIDCDGCGIAGLEFREHRRDEAFEECGWVRVPDKAWHLCPVCRPDSPFEAVKRVRALADQMDKASDAHTRALAASIRNAVEGESDG